MNNPTIDAARRKLGGRGSTTMDAGRIVSLSDQREVSVIGVVLFASPDECDVWIDEGIVRRTKMMEVHDFAGMVPQELVQLADDIRGFARLREGQRVRVEAPKGTFCEGGIVEKCRFGAIVLRDDGSVVAVGFRKVWPLVPDVSAPN